MNKMGRVIYYYKLHQQFISRNIQNAQYRFAKVVSTIWATPKNYSLNNLILFESIRLEMENEYRIYRFDIVFYSI